MRPVIKRFFIHLSLIIGIIVVIMLLSQSWLKYFTRHGQSLIVPDFTGMSVALAQKVAKTHALQVELLDSLYLPNGPRGTVFRQIPLAR